MVDKVIKKEIIFQQLNCQIKEKVIEVKDSGSPLAKPNPKLQTRIFQGAECIYLC